MDNPKNQKSISKYKKLEDYKVEYYSEELSPEEMILKKLLENSVKLHQRSDVPYGIFFSGFAN